MNRSCLIKIARPWASIKKQFEGTYGVFCQPNTMMNVQMLEAEIQKHG